jgi:hypothetical protein
VAFAEQTLEMRGATVDAIAMPIAAPSPRPAAIQARAGVELCQAQLSLRAMDCGLSPDHHLQKRRLGSPGTT